MCVLNPLAVRFDCPPFSVTPGRPCESAAQLSLLRESLLLVFGDLLGVCGLQGITPEQRSKFAYPLRLHANLVKECVEASLTPVNPSSLKEDFWSVGRVLLFRTQSPAVLMHYLRQYFSPYITAKLLPSEDPTYAKTLVLMAALAARPPPLTELCVCACGATLPPAAMHAPVLPAANIPSCGLTLDRSRDEQLRRQLPPPPSCLVRLLHHAAKVLARPLSARGGGVESFCDAERPFPRENGNASWSSRVEQRVSCRKHGRRPRLASVRRGKFARRSGDCLQRRHRPPLDCADGGRRRRGEENVQSLSGGGALRRPPLKDLQTQGRTGEAAENAQAQRGLTPALCVWSIHSSARNGGRCC